MTRDGNTPRRNNTKASRIRERLDADIRAGAFEGSRLLPTEALLCARYGASRETIRKAVRLSIAQGLLTRIPNRGVAIHAPPGERSPTSPPYVIVLTPYPFKSMNYYYHGILTGLVAGSHEMGVALKFVTRTAGTDLPAAAAGHPTIVWPAEPGDRPALRRMMDAGRQFVVMSSSFATTDLPCVGCDNPRGANQAVDCLFKQGHRRIGIVARSSQASLDHAQRITAARKRLRTYGLPTDAGLVFWPRAEWSAQTYDRAFAAWRRDRRLTAVFTLDLEIAGRVYACAEARQLTIPHMLSVISFDDCELAEVYDPRITTVAQPLTEIGRHAVERLVTAVGRRRACRGTERLPTWLVERESVVPPPA